MSRSLARDLGQHGIRVNTLVPGWIMTERQLTHWVGDAENKLIDEQQALARPASIRPISPAWRCSSPPTTAR